MSQTKHAHQTHEYVNTEAEIEKYLNNFIHTLSIF